MAAIIQHVKSLLKKPLQILAANYGRHTRKAKQPELLILMYHRILPLQDQRAQQEEPGMMVSPETFALHISIIRERFEIMHLSQWLELKNKGENLPERCCAITFDDGWADNYEYAFPVLQQHNIPATIFLVSNMIGKQNDFWPGRLARVLTNIAQQHSPQWSHSSLNWIKQCKTDFTFSSTAPTQEQLSDIINEMKAYNDDDIHQRLDDIESSLQLDIKDSKPLLLDWRQVNTMCDTGLIEVGSHTCNHIRLTQDGNKEQLQDEIINSKATIEQYTGKEVKTFCYPNGDYSEHALSIVKQNYHGAVTTCRGWNTIESNDHLLQRIGVHEDISNNKTRFLARISGWL